MAINKNSNAYIIIYTVVMVVIVGTLLAVLATSLKGKQDANVLNEQKVSIMKAFGEADANFDEVVDVCRLTGGELGVVADEAGVQSVFDLLGNRKALSEAEDGLPIFRMRKELADTPFLFLIGGSYSSIIRQTGPLFGVCMYLCAPVHRSGYTRKQPLLRNMRQVRDHLLHLL